ncbi:hypothetical protein [Flavivirga spongiicola]|uniref:DUF4625 domain-containing protein n=1 Tax=Flavivirga spongiicola TaxID=421621 RepID=A0ABU7XV88_9FLAO|nr:hypothetical protein [Flavivirga sp. MEBiC05379]MDO5979690.1 hypothetical protein [Flavivirga sp. MEBiC05379]
MKSTIKISSLLFLTLLIFSCSTDDDGVDFIPENKNLNAERFINFEIGNSNFIVPQSAADIHLNFDYNYKGQSKVSKITLHAIAINVDPVQEGEKTYELKDYVVDDKYYKGKLNPNIHLHLFVDPEGKESPKFKAATGSYQFRIVVEHEDLSKAVILKEFSFVQKFKDIEVEIEEDGLEKELHIEFQYLTGSNTLEEIKYTLYHEESATEQKYKEILSETNIDFQDKKDPNVHFHVEWENEYPKGVYYLLLKVKETGEDEYVKLVRKFEAN